MIDIPGQTSHDAPLAEAPCPAGGDPRAGARRREPATMTRLDSLTPRRPPDRLAPGGRIGVIALATDFNIEDELPRLLPPDLAVFTTRVRNVNPLTIDNLRTMAPGISAAADALLPGTPLAAIVYACTSGTAAIGSERVTRLVHATRPGVAVTNPVTAARAAFAAFGARRISILTPYTRAVNAELARVFSDGGPEVLNVAGFGFEDDTAMSFISPQDIVEAAMETCDRRADLLFVSCTALRVAGVTEALEARLGKPVLSSNPVLAWHCLRLLDDPRGVPGYGMLMRQDYRLAGAG